MVQSKVLINTLCILPSNSLRSHLILSNLTFSLKRWQLWEHSGESRLNRTPVLSSSDFPHVIVPRMKQGYCHASCGVKKSVCLNCICHGCLKYLLRWEASGNFCSFLKPVNCWCSGWFVGNGWHVHECSIHNWEVFQGHRNEREPVVGKSPQKVDKNICTMEQIAES